MSDRVARLAEIRRKRKAQEQGDAVDSEVSPVVEKVVTGKSEKGPIKDHVTGMEEDAKKDEKEKGKEKEKKYETFEEKEKVESNEDVDNLPEEKIEVEASDPGIEPLIEKVTYNSDLKRDLAPYLKQAKLETDRALNRILQEKYQQAARDNKEDA